MNNTIMSESSDCKPSSNRIVLKTEPEKMEIDGFRTAAIIVDMQNAFVSKGGMSDLRGIDISKGLGIIGRIKEIANAVRSFGGKVFYIVTRYSDDLREGGGKDSPNWYKGTMTTYRDHPE